MEIDYNGHTSSCRAEEAVRATGSLCLKVPKSSDNLIINQLNKASIPKLCNCELDTHEHPETQIFECRISL